MPQVAIRPQAPRPNLQNRGTRREIERASNCGSIATRNTHRTLQLKSSEEGRRLGPRATGLATSGVAPIGSAR
eukprot:4929365-Alexandrium_andersonii.AAC.1